MLAVKALWIKNTSKYIRQYVSFPNIIYLKTTFLEIIDVLHNSFIRYGLLQMIDSDAKQFSRIQKILSRKRNTHTFFRRIIHNQTDKSCGYIQKSFS